MLYEHTINVIINKRVSIAKGFADIKALNGNERFKLTLFILHKRKAL